MVQACRTISLRRRGGGAAPRAARRRAARRSRAAISARRMKPSTVRGHYDFCVAAGKSESRSATGAGGDWSAAALHTCRLAADGHTITVVSSTPLPCADPPGYQIAVRLHCSDRHAGVLYACAGGEILWLAIDGDGVTTSCGSASTNGGRASHLCTDEFGRLLFTANYGHGPGGGSVSVLPITCKDGALGSATVYRHGRGAHHGKRGEWGEGPQYRQEAPHPHGVAVCGGQLYVADLGSNQVVCWAIDFDRAKLRLSSVLVLHDLAGPRHIQFTRCGRAGFVLNELDNTVCVLHRDEKRGGRLTLVQTLSTLPAGWIESHNDPASFPNAVYSQASHASELMISPDDRYVYCSNRGHDSIAALAIRRTDWTLSPVQYCSTLGRIPWVFCMSTDGRFVVVQNNHTRAQEEGPDSLIVFARDATSGHLRATGARLEFPTITSVWTLPSSVPVLSTIANL